MFTGQNSTDYQDSVIKNNGFWPDLNAGDFEKRRGVPIDLNAEQTVFTIVSAIAQINIELQSPQTEYQGQGYEKAEDVEGQPSFDGKNMLVILYEKAVFARAKSELLPEYATQQTKDAGENVASSQSEIRDQLLAESQQHIRAIKGKGRCGISLL